MTKCEVLSEHRSRGTEENLKKKNRNLDSQSPIRGFKPREFEAVMHPTMYPECMSILGCTAEHFYTFLICTICSRCLVCVTVFGLVTPATVEDQTTCKF